MNRVKLQWLEYAKSRSAAAQDYRPVVLSKEMEAFYAGARAFAGLLNTYGDEPDLWRELDAADSDA